MAIAAPLNRANGLWLWAQLFVRGSILRATITDMKSPISDGYERTNRNASWAPAFNTIEQAA